MSVSVSVCLCLSLYPPGQNCQRGARILLSVEKGEKPLGYCFHDSSVSGVLLEYVYHLASVGRPNSGVINLSVLIDGQKRSNGGYLFQSPGRGRGLHKVTLYRTAKFYLPNPLLFYPCVSGDGRQSSQPEAVSLGRQRLRSLYGEDCLSWVCHLSVTHLKYNITMDRCVPQCFIRRLLGSDNVLIMIQRGARKRRHDSGRAKMVRV